MHARDVMTSPVITAGPETTVLDIVSLMLDNRIGTEYHRSWWLSAFGGAITLAEDFVKSHGVKASEIMTCLLYTSPSPRDS